MATKTKNPWNVQKANKAAEKHRFIHVGGTSGGDWALSGAKKHWDDGKDYVYLPNPALRVAGTRQEVFGFLKSYAPALGDEQINSYIEQNGFTLNNRAAKAAQIDQLVNAQKAYDKAHQKDKKPTDEYTLAQVKSVLASLNTASNVDTSTKKAGKGKAPGVETLYSKISKLMKDNVGKRKDSGEWMALNVTKMTPDGKGARRQKYNHKGNKMIVVGELPLMVNKTDSDARAAYDRAIDMLNRQAPAGENYDTYKNQFLQESAGTAITSLISGQATAAPAFTSVTAIRTPTGLPPVSGVPTGLPQLPTLV